VHNNTVQNLRRGLAERVFNVETPAGLAPPPKPNRGVFWSRLAVFKDRLLTHMPYAAPLSSDEFVNSYKGDRRMAVYAEAAESLRTRPIDRRDAYLTTFVKAEKINFTSKADPAPRVIQPRSPRYNLMVGRYLKRMEKSVYRAIAEVYGGKPVVMKGYNVHGIAEQLRDGWESFDDPIAIGLDASRFDQHISSEALRWEHSVYLSRYSGRHRSELAQLLSWQIRNKGVGRATDGIVKYAVEGCRMSGDMNTSLGNCLIMCALVWSYCSGKGIKHRLFNNGDDCVVIMSRRNLQRFVEGLEEWFTEMGFTMKVEKPVTVFEQIEFCQTRPVFDGDTYVMCRDPRVCMAKDSVALLPLEQGNMGRGWCTAIGECGLSLAGGLPILQDFYCAVLRAGDGVRIKSHPALESGFARMAVGMARRCKAITDATRISFWEAFGVLPSEQETYEDALRSSSPVPTHCRHGKTLEDTSFVIGQL
jgi:hypothetical protein